MTGYVFSVGAAAGGSTLGAGADMGAIAAVGGVLAVGAAGGSLSTSVSSWRTVLLARRSSRKIFPTVRITSGRRSGPMTISAIARMRAISKRSKLR
jgi:hypothetical protein